MDVKYKQLLYLTIIILILLFIYFYIFKKVENFKNNEPIELEIVENNGGGFFSNFNMLIYNLTKYKTVNKINFNVKSNKKAKVLYYIKEDEELFSKLFDVYDDGITSTKKIVSKSYIDYSITGIDAYKFYNENRNKLQPYYDTYKKYIKIKKHIQNKINKKCIELKENADQLICIFVRSDALRKEQPSKKMPSRDDYDKAIDNIPKSNNVKYFLCIDNNKDLEYYKNKYTPNYYTTIRRTRHTKDGEPHRNNIGTLTDLEDSFIEVVIMSQCDILVHCVSNMATASLYMNMKQQSICVSK